MKQFTEIMVLSVILLSLAACGEDRASDYMPMVTGQVYVYNIETTHGDNSSSKKSIMEITGPFDLDGQPVYMRNHGVFFQDVLTKTDKGVYLLGDMRHENITRYENPGLLLPAGIEQGHDWTGYASSDLLLWRKHALEHANRLLQERFQIEYRCVSMDETVTTPAGTFTNVMRIEGSGSHVFELGAVKDRNRISIQQTRWYAPGVGLVKSVREEASEGGLLIAGKRVRELSAVY